MRPVGRTFIAQALKTALLAAMCLGPVVAARAASVTGTAAATIVTPLSVVKNSDLQFGAIIPGAAAGTVSINVGTGARTSTGPLTLVGTGFSRAQFLGLGQNTFIVQIQRTGPQPVLTRVSGTQTMNATLTGLPTIRLFPGTGIITVNVGGNLSVAANQMPGFYTGTFSVTMTYF